MPIAARAAISQGPLCSLYSALHPPQPRHVGDGAQHQGCLGSRAQARPIHLLRVTCCHLSPAPPAHTGAQGCPWSPPPSPSSPPHPPLWASPGPAAAGNGNSGGSSKAEPACVSPSGFPEPEQPRANHGAAGISLTTSNPVSAHPCSCWPQQSLLRSQPALTSCCRREQHGAGSVPMSQLLQGVGGHRGQGPCSKRVPDQDKQQNAGVDRGISGWTRRTETGS